LKWDILVKEKFQFQGLTSFYPAIFLDGDFSPVIHYVFIEMVIRTCQSFFREKGGVNLGGGTASHSPFQRSPELRPGSLPPLLGRGMNPRPAPASAGASFDRQPFGFPDDRFPAACRGAYQPIVKILFKTRRF